LHTSSLILDESKNVQENQNHLCVAYISIANMIWIGTERYWVFLNSTSLLNDFRQKLIVSTYWRSKGNAIYHENCKNWSIIGSDLVSEPSRYRDVPQRWLGNGVHWDPPHRSSIGDQYRTQGIETTPGMKLDFLLDEEIAGGSH
jgi:hypothetical protein